VSSMIRIGARRVLLLALLVVGLSAGLVPPAFATKIERVVSPSGIEAWLVREPALPMIAMEYAFVGGSSQDPADRPGLAYMLSTLLDEGAGNLDSRAFSQRLEAKAIELRFIASHDVFGGSIRTLTEHRDEAFDLLRLALNQPRFDPEPIERMRAQLLAGLQREEMSPGDLAGRRWWEKAFAGHPYGHPVHGTTESLKAINAADLRTYAHRIFARDTLKIAIVGDIDAATAGRLIDQVFGKLPAKADLFPVPETMPKALGDRIPVELDVAQSALVLGAPGLKRSDPDFVTAYVVNHILGGGAFTSRLYHEVRESRGLAYSVYSAMLPLMHSGVFFVSTGTRSDRVNESIAVIEKELRRMAKDGPTEKELAEAKSFLKGSYALAFDSSLKIAGQLVQIQLDHLGIDYINKRNSLIDAVTMADAKRVAKRLLDSNLFVTIAGRSPVAANSAPAAREAQ
jgi:zinc protease